jgi:hypothetical protein
MPQGKVARSPRPQPTSISYAVQFETNDPSHSKAGRASSQPVLGTALVVVRLAPRGQASVLDRPEAQAIREERAPRRLPRVFARDDAAVWLEETLAATVLTAERAVHYLRLALAAGGRLLPGVANGPATRSNGPVRCGNDVVTSQARRSRLAARQTFTGQFLPGEHDDA